LKLVTLVEQFSVETVLEEQGRGINSSALKFGLIFDSITKFLYGEEKPFSHPIDKMLYLWVEYPVKLRTQPKASVLKA
jgi:hypothetical protein